MTARLAVPQEVGARGTMDVGRAALVAAGRLGICPDAYRARREAGEKWCWSCREWTDVEAFVRDRAKSDGYSTICRRCHRERYSKESLPTAYLCECGCGEEINAFVRQIDGLKDRGLNHGQIALRLQVSREYVSRMLNLRTRPKTIKGHWSRIYWASGRGDEDTRRRRELKQAADAHFMAWHESWKPVSQARSRLGLARHRYQRVLETTRVIHRRKHAQEQVRSAERGLQAAMRVYHAAERERLARAALAAREAGERERQQLREERVAVRRREIEFRRIEREQRWQEIREARRVEAELRILERTEASRLAREERDLERWRRWAARQQAAEMRKRDREHEAGLKRQAKLRKQIEARERESDRPLIWSMLSLDAPLSDEVEPGDWYEYTQSHDPRIGEDTADIFARDETAETLRRIVGDIGPEDVGRMDESTLARIREKLIAEGIQPGLVTDSERERLRDPQRHAGGSVAKAKGASTRRTRKQRIESAANKTRVRRDMRPEQKKQHAALRRARQDRLVFDTPPEGVSLEATP